jgi:hypothetical protein
LGDLHGIGCGSEGVPLKIFVDFPATRLDRFSLIGKFLISQSESQIFRRVVIDHRFHRSPHAGDLP